MYDVCDRVERDHDKYWLNERVIKNEEQHVIPVSFKGSTDQPWVTTEKQFPFNLLIEGLTLSNSQVPDYKKTCNH